MGMMMKKMGMDDARDRVLDELLAHLDKSDGRDLGDAIKPKDGAGLEVMKIEKLGGEGEPDADDDQKSPGVMDAGAGEGAEGGSGSKMSDEEIDELMEALKQKLGG